MCYWYGLALLPLETPASLGHRGLRRWQPYSPAALETCELRRHARRHDVWRLPRATAWRRTRMTYPFSPCFHRWGTLPPKRNRNETWGGPSELSGVRQAARCLYDAGEPSWARSRCYSSSRQPIQQYTACVGLSLIFHKVTVRKKRKKDGN